MPLVPALIYTNTRPDPGHFVCRLNILNLFSLIWQYYSKWPSRSGESSRHFEFNLLRPLKWYHMATKKPEATLAPIMVCCLAAPGHYLNQCCLVIKGVLCNSPESNFTRSARKLNPNLIRKMCLEIALLKITATSSKDLWVIVGCRIWAKSREIH